MGVESGSGRGVRTVPLDATGSSASGSLGARSRMRSVRGVGPSLGLARLSAPDAFVAEPALPGLGIPEGVHFHVLSFEGPDAYARIGGLETRVAGVCEALVSAAYETHLWFVGDARLPSEEEREGLQLHRWCQWLSQYHPAGAYDGETSKVPDYAASLPPHLMARHLVPHLRGDGFAVILAEEWQTVDAVLHLDHLLRARGLRDRVRILWNANNVFGFDRIDWPRLRDAAVVTTVSRYMKQILKRLGVDAIEIPNGLAPGAYLPPDRAAVAQLRKGFAGRTAITKIARWDPDKRWLGSIEIVARLRELGMRPLLVARGGREPYGAEILRAMRRAGLSIVERDNATGDPRGLVQALSDVAGADVVHLVTHIGRDSLRVLFRASDVVLANSGHEPFGLVGLEAMAAGGVVCTGSTGEVYAIPGHNALVIQTEDDAQEFVALYRQVLADRGYEAALRRAGRATARRFAWAEVIRTHLTPRLDLLRAERPAEC
jgi:glycosyltransferase involved in cell wall biosynthesis